MTSATRRPPLGTVAVPPEVSHVLATRLRRETQGEVLFDEGSRGRYATDASIYQIMPAGVFVPRNEADIATAISLARDLRDDFFAGIDVGEGVGHHNTRDPGRLSAARC